ncbi:MAG: S9 family peptidase, partial [Acidimicrobiia bacterium]
MSTSVPPSAPRRPHEVSAHGRTRVDEWYWFRDRNNPEVIDHLRAENAYADTLLEPLQPLRDSIFEEIKTRLRETDASAPVTRKEWEYFTRTREGAQYAFHCRRPRGTAGLPDPDAQPGAPADEVVLLDENALAGDSPYFALGGFAMRPDQNVVAYLIDLTGAERHELRFRDIASGDDLDDLIEDVSYGLAWGNDNRTVFYTRMDEALRPYQVWRHTLGTPAANDMLVFEEPDERFNVGVGRTRSDALIIVSSDSKITTEHHLIDADAPETAPRVVAPREEGVEYHVDHHRGPDGDRLYVLTNADGAENFKLCVAPLATPSREHWRTIVEARTDVRLDDMDVFRSHLLVAERSDGLARISWGRIEPDGSLANLTPVVFPVEPVTAWMGSNAEFDVTTARVCWTSLSQPLTDSDFDLTTGALTEVKRQPVGGGYDASEYESAREWATAPDGTRIPMSIVWKRGTRRNGSAPALLYGYGSYEYSIDPTFSASRLSLLDRGFVYAIAHIRGGGEMGRHWYDDGKLANKHHTFSDFVACAEHLVANKWTAPDRLVIRGGSAGGLLMGASVNLRPDLFAGVIAEVPFVDVVTTMLDPSIPLTVPEYEEWGNPSATLGEYERLLSYSPYDNIVPRDYPAMLVE